MPVTGRRFKDMSRWLVTLANALNFNKYGARHEDSPTGSELMYDDLLSSNTGQLIA